MRTAAILPVKRFPAAKTRLGDALGQPTRRALAAAMAEDVLGALAEVSAISWTLVVTAEEQVAAAARQIGAGVVADFDEQGQSSAVARGIARALELGAERVLCVPGDCPSLVAGEVEELLGSPPRAGAREVVIVPDRHGTGTNALLLTPPGVIAPSFGPGSCERHRRLAGQARAGCRLAHPPSLLLDVDTGADLEVLRERLALERLRAPGTRRVLDAVRASSGVPSLQA